MTTPNPEKSRTTGSDNNGIDKTGPDNADSKRRPFLKGLLTGGVVGTLIAGSVGALAQHDGHGQFWKAGCSHRHAMRDPDVMKERADFMVEWTLSRIDAADEQRAQVKSVVKAAIDDLLQLREEHQVNRKAMIAALIEPEVDRGELDRIRSAEISLADRASRRIVSALADTAEALTPEQRAQLAEMANRWRGRRHEL
ncbi:MAG: Spy/CpxP family protein refolding chaperone [Betaproteobacteria bacterium]|jgi:Spy/CpxP family protein refolding chaperone|nr:MAG: Spy/CpxP family protein refolding chaperone [Betaproteobacteria bacterium]